MTIGIIGCGAIGGLFLGYLTKAGVPARGLIRHYQKEAMAHDGLLIEGVRGLNQIHVTASTQLSSGVDVAVFTTKINDLTEVLKRNASSLKGAVAVSTQNGVRADYILQEYFAPEKIITGVVMFGGTFYPPNRVVHNFEGDFIIGNIFNKEVAHMAAIKDVFAKAFNVVESDTVKGAKYLKVFINLNNCIPACLGCSVQEAFSDVSMAVLAMELNREAYRVVKGAGITLSDLPAYPEERLIKLVSMDLGQAAGIFSGIMTSLSKEPLYGSILQSIKRNKPSEIDFINGEIVHLARSSQQAAPLNERIVSLVHAVEKNQTFLSKDELKNALYAKQKE